MGVNRVIDPSWVAGLGVIIFSIGLWGAFTRKNAIIVLMCIELILNAVNLNFVAGAAHYGDESGWMYAAFAIAIAAAEVAIGLAIFLSLYSKHKTISLDETFSCGTPSNLTFIFLSLDTLRHCVARTCSTSDVPIPIAKQPNAP